MHKSHQVVNDPDKKGNFFFISGEHLWGLIDVCVLAVVILFHVPLHLIHICFRDDGVGVHDCNENGVHVHIIFQQLWGHISDTIVDVTRFGFRLSWHDLMDCVGNEPKIGTKIFDHFFSLLFSMDFMLFHG